MTTTGPRGLLWRLVLRSLTAHRARLAMTFAAVLLGTGFVAGTLLLTASTDTRAIRDGLLGLAAVALLVGAFVIANTFSMLVGQRTRELALLRAVGMSRRQLRWLVLGEAAAVGLAGALAGTAAGWAFAAVAVPRSGRGAGTAHLVVSVPALLAALTVGVGVTILSAWASARRAARVPPVAALRGEVTSPQADIRRRTVAGAVLAVPGAGVYAYAALSDRVDEQLATVGLAGAGLLIAAMALLAPALCDLLLRPLAGPLGRAGPVGRLAAGNARRDPRRTAATASALMVGLSVVVSLAIFGQSVKQEILTGVRRDVAAQLVVQPPASRDATIPAATVERLAAVPGVGAVAALRYALPAARIGPVETRAPTTVVDPAAVGDALRLSMVAGRAGDLAAGVLASDDLALRYRLSVGDRLTVTWPDGGRTGLDVTGLYRRSDLASGLLVPQAVALPHLDRPGTTVALVALAPGAREGAVRAGLEAAVAGDPGVVVRSRAEYLGARLRQVDAPLRLLYALLALAVVIAVLGVANTLALSVTERTREIGLLRALGLTRRGLRVLIRVESALVVLVGGLLGLGGGYLLGAMFQRGALRTGLLDAAVPVGQLLLALAGLAAACLLAAAWPARRAARTDPLTALAGE
jgi:putative ABC transport system permease protein